MAATAIHDREWVTTTGALLLAAGAATIIYASLADIGSVAGFGWLLFCAGVMEVGHAVQVRARGGFLMYLLDGLVRAGAGIFLMWFPGADADDLALLLSVYLFAAGVLRTIVAAILEFPAWVWTAVSGLISMTVAALIALQWPAHAPFLVALGAATDLILYGWSLLMYAAATRSSSSCAPAGTPASPLALPARARSIPRGFSSESL